MAWALRFATVFGTPLGIAILSLLIGIFGALLIVLGLGFAGLYALPLIGHVEPLVGLFLGAVFVVLGALDVALAIGIFQLRRWAWWIGLFVQAWVAIAAVSSGNLPALLFSVGVIAYLIAKRYQFSR